MHKRKSSLKTNAINFIEKPKKKSNKKPKKNNSDKSSLSYSTSLSNSVDTLVSTFKDLSISALKGVKYVSSIATPSYFNPVNKKKSSKTVSNSRLEQLLKEGKALKTPSPVVYSTSSSKKSSTSSSKSSSKSSPKHSSKRTKR